MLLNKFDLCRNTDMWSIISNYIDGIVIIFP